jgi:hypothetical protein
VGHGCHDCGSPNSCECIPGVDYEQRRKDALLKDLERNAQRVLERADELIPTLEKVLSHAPREHIRYKALVMAILEVV